MICNKDGCSNIVTPYRIKVRTYSCHSCAALWSRYKITRKERDDLLELQGGACAICNTDLSYEAAEPNKKGDVVCVDHCHETGFVRGILCRKCNVGLGKFRDDITILQNAIKYLEKERTKGGK